MSYSLSLAVSNQQVDLTFSSNSGLQSQLERIVASFLALEQLNFQEASIAFIDDSTMCSLHAEYFNDPSSTDCISFPMDADEEDNEEGYRILGDIFVCPATAIKYVKKNGGDPYEETTLYVIHGLLHLIGYDDIEEEDQLDMRAAEARHLNNLKRKGLLLKKG